MSERLIAVRTVDGKLHGISPKDGQDLWSQEQQVPRLSLRGTASPVLTGDLVLSGFDNGKVAAVNANDGSVQWETTISPAHGKTELERMDDVDSTVRVSGSDVFAIGFQGRISMLALDTGQTWWSHDASSFRAIGLDDSSLYISTSDGEVVALRRRTGTELWRQKSSVASPIVCRCRDGHVDRNGRLPGLRTLARQGYWRARCPRVDREGTHQQFARRRREHGVSR